MKHLRPYRYVILIVLPIVILVVVRAFAPGFKPDADKLAKASFTGANMLNREQVAALATQPLVIKLSSEQTSQPDPFSDTIFIAADKLLDKPNIKIIHAHRGPVVLVSDDPSVSAKAWMILSQMGYRDLFILAEKDNDEVLKYEFGPGN